MIEQSFKTNVPTLDNSLCTNRNNMTGTNEEVTFQREKNGVKKYAAFHWKLYSAHIRNTKRTKLDTLLLKELKISRLPIKILGECV